MIKYYKLVGRTPVTCTFEEFAEQFGNNDSRMIAKTDVDSLTVSTIFLGLDHQVYGEGPLQLFETMVFDNHGKAGSEVGDWMNRYSTYAQALDGHNKTVDRLKHLLTQSQTFHYDQPD